MDLRIGAELCSPENLMRPLGRNPGRPAAEYGIWGLGRGHRHSQGRDTCRYGGKPSLGADCKKELSTPGKQAIVL
jgi:hypothetical protein